MYSAASRIISSTSASLAFSPKSNNASKNAFRLYDSGSSPQKSPHNKSTFRLNRIVRQRGSVRADFIQLMIFLSACRLRQKEITWIANDNSIKILIGSSRADLSARKETSLKSVSLAGRKTELASILLRSSLSSIGHQPLLARIRSTAIDSMYLYCA